LVEVPRTERNRIGAASVADPVNPAMTGGMGGLLQMLMQFIQQLFGGASGGLGSFFSGLTGNTSRNATDGPNGRSSPGNTPSPDGPSVSRNGVVNVPSDGRFSSAEALRTCRSDNARGGYCGRGVHNVLESQGYRVTNGDGHNWDQTLPRDGWVMLRGVNARNAPEGAVLVYDSDVQDGRRARNNGGGKFGHVEVVCYDANGNRKYVSDAARDNFGGTVPDNFVGAYVPRERYELMLAQQRQERQAETAVARNDSPATGSGRNTSVAASVDGQVIQTASLRTSFADADQRRLVATASPAAPAVQPNAAPVPALS
jgi:hypothetical protein